MARPETVQIGPIQYTISFDQAVLDGKSLENKMELVGLCEIYDSLIHVSPDMSTEIQNVTLIHEILHAIWFDANLSQVKEPTQENTISMLAPRLLTFLRENPHIVKYIS